MLPNGVNIQDEDGSKGRGIPFSVSMRHAFVPFPGNSQILLCASYLLRI